MKREEKQLESSVEAMIQRLTEVKNSITSLLVKLEQENENVTWPSVLDSYALISSQLNSLTRVVRSEKTPTLKDQILLPLQLSPDPDVELQKSTEGRVVAFNHELVPTYLRTKPEPEAEARIQQLAGKAGNIMDSIQKQINNHNKVVTSLQEMIKSNQEEWEREMTSKSQQPQFSSQSDTNTLISAISKGQNMRVQRPPSQPAATSSTSQVTKVPSSARANIKATTNVHPYARP